MSAFKSLTSQDVIVTPFVVNKSFSFEGSASYQEPEVGIERYIGTNIPKSIPFNSGSDPVTGDVVIQYQRDVYGIAKQLYYTNELPCTDGTYIVTDLNGNIVTSNLQTYLYSRFDNYLQSTLYNTRYFPTGAYEGVGVLSIPRKLFGEYINPNTFAYVTYAYLPDPLIISASLTQSILDKQYIDNLPIINNNGFPPIQWTTHYNPGNWFNGGIINAPITFNTYTITATASFAAQSGSLYVAPQDYDLPTTSYTDFEAGSPYVLEITASNVTLSLAIDNGNGTYTNLATENVTLLQDSSVVVYISASNLSYTNTNIVLIPTFDANDPFDASTIVDIDLNVVDDNGGIVTLVDDGEGYIYLEDKTTFSESLGTIAYPHGLMVLTNQLAIVNFTGSNITTCSFQSARTIYEAQYKCTIRENEFNYSLNPSLISGSNFTNPLVSTCSLDITGKAYDFVTGSFFAPYVTTVGLYNEMNELLAVGKLSQPLPTSRTTDMSILVNLDL